MNTEEKKVCDCCAVIIEDEETSYETRDGETICEDCFESKYMICECCDEVVPMDECIEISGRYICENCREEHTRYYRCAECEEWFDTHADGGEETADGRIVCQSCYEREYAECDECGGVFRTSDMTYDSYREEYYCDQCDRRRRKKAIHDYSYKPNPKFKTLSHDEFLTDSDIRELLFGVELEVDKGDDPEELAEEITENNEDIYCKHDGSLINGVEIVTHPCTLEYHKKELGWDKICEMARNKNFYGQRAETCGLHIHVGRNQLGETITQRNQTAAKIIILTKRHWEQLVKFSRRAERRLNEWAAEPQIDISSCSTIDELIHIALETKLGGRYQAINLDNSNTIEFRLWNSTLKPSTIIATLQLTSNICLYAKEHTVEEMLASGWNDITSLYTHKELQNYLKDRGLDNIPRQEPMKLREDKAQDGTGKMRIGTRVRIINADGGGVTALKNLIGLEATICYTKKYDIYDYGVEFDEEHDLLHSLNDTIEGLKGYWVHASNIEPVTENIDTFLF